MAYLDQDGQIAETGGMFRDFGVLQQVSEGSSNWRNKRIGSSMDVSGLAVAELNEEAHVFYIDDEFYLTELTKDNAKRIGPKAAKDSNIAVAHMFGTSNLHLFYLSEDMDLCRVEFDGEKWLPGMVFYPSYLH